MPAVKVRDKACMLIPNSGAKSRLGLSYPGEPEVVHTSSSAYVRLLAEDSGRCGHALDAILEL